MSDVTFSSINPYQSLQVIVADDPQSLVGLLTKIDTPIKIIAIVSFGTSSRQAAYVMGDVRKIKPKKGTK